ncbi:MAG: hypothetical protein KME20_24845 [Kaiparowitsia implicata GSE-PSE-MK54-09C]|jgi:hypothetical protein|nr:hypothetical protein [Kaiparowitsia implicata GSE-PSE-MK54-09C]
MAPTTVNVFNNPVDELINRILAERRITRADQERFMTALLSKDRLSDRERTQIDRLFDALRAGRIRVVD